MRLNAVAGPQQERLFQVAIVQPSDRGNRDRDQPNHRYGKPGCERHVGARSPSAPARRTAGQIGCYGALRGGSNTAARWRAAFSGFQAARDSCEEVGWPERFLQAGDRSELGRHGQEVRGRVGFQRDRPAGDDDDRMVSNPSIPGMKMSRNNRSKFPVWHNATPFRPSSAVTTLWPARSSNRRTVIWTAPSSSTTSILAKAKSSPGPAGIRSTAGCEFCRIVVVLQLPRRYERSG